MKSNMFFVLFIMMNLFMANFAFAVTPEANHITAETKVRAELQKDLAIPYTPSESLMQRESIDGRSLTDFQGDIVEFWLNLECGYCGVQEPLMAQRQNDNMRIIVRHLPSDNYGEALKKALSYEALKVFSANAANMFWDKIIPKTSLVVPVPYEASLMLAFQEAAISPEEFTDVLENQAVEIINADILAGYGRITSTPTYILNGIRFYACNFTADQLPKALDLAKKARMGNNDAKEKIIDIIVQGVLGEIKI